MMTVIPGQRTESTPVIAATPCAVEGCTDAGTLRRFPHYLITLCVTHFVIAADEHAKRGVAS